MHNKLNISLHSSDCPEENKLRAYSLGQLSKDEIRKIEEHLTDCEMCSDYLEGLSLLSGTEELDKEASDIIAKINSARTKKNRLWLYATAASVFLAISLFTFIWYLPSKNNYVADKFENKPAKTDQQISIIDSVSSPDNGLIKNPSDAIATSDIEKEKCEKKIIIQDQQEVFSAIIEESSGEAQKDQTVSQNYWTADRLKAGDIKEKDIADERTIDTKVTVATGSTTNTTVALEQNQDITVAGGMQLATVTESEDANNKFDKKSRNENAKNSETRSIADGSKSKEEAPAFTPTTSEPGRKGFLDDFEKSESNSDLDKAEVYLSQQIADSAIVYATKAITTCDSCKWIAKLLLSKAYVAAGQKEKAISILKDVKTNGPSKYSKEAKTELDKLSH